MGLFFTIFSESVRLCVLKDASRGRQIPMLSRVIFSRGFCKKGDYCELLQELVDIFEDRAKKISRVVVQETAQKRPN